jgi:hypothetical protein
MWSNPDCGGGFLTFPKAVGGGRWIPGDVVAKTIR